MGKGSSSPRHKGVEGRGDSIRLRFQYRGRRSETLKLEPTPANLKYASQLRGEIQRKITLGTFRYADYFPDSKFAKSDVAPAKSFREVSQAWLAAASLEKSTREGYEKSLRKHVWPAIGDKPINQIAKLDIVELLGAIDASKKTRNNTLIPIRRTFDMADLPVNPAANIKYAKHQTPPPDPFEPDEVRAILGMLEQRYGPMVNYFGLGFFAGPRPSELIAVQWPDVDFRTEVWRVQRARVRLEEKGTKTGVIRDHQISARALEYLKAQRAETLLRTRQEGQQHVFLDPVTGAPFNDDKPPRERYWRPTLTALGIRYRPPEQMRHTYITLAIMAGASPTWVAGQAGNSPEVIFKHYFRWLNAVDRGREAAKVSAALGQIWGKSVGDDRGTTGGAA